MYFVYLLECADRSLYTGITNNLAKRLEAHNLGKGARYTAARLPVRLVYREEQPDKSSALKREYQLKQLTREQKLALVASKMKA